MQKQELVRIKMLEGCCFPTFLQTLASALRKFVSHYQHEQGISEAALTTALKMFSHSKSTASGISYYRRRVDSSGKEIKEVRLSSLHTFVLRL